MPPDRGPRNSSWQGARSTPVVGLSFDHHTAADETTKHESPPDKLSVVVRDGAPTLFSHQVQITLCDSFLYAKNTALVGIYSKLCEIFREKCINFFNSKTGVQLSMRNKSVSDKTIAKMEEALLKDRRVMVRDYGEMIPHVNKALVYKILTGHLGYAKVYARWVLKMFAENNKRKLVEAAHEFL
ncbi:HTH_48 domain-containing protein [Trichonephila clavipes]|nr:HTH_48 domain-containing protein [Trichonephila clavipes]